VFVLSPSYHGATLLALLLNEHRAVVDLGDTNPETGRDIPCRCGRTVGTCDFWSLLSRELDPPLVPGSNRWFPSRPPFTRWTRVNTILSYPLSIVSRVTGRRVHWPLTSGLARYREAHERVVHLATEAMDARVFVDGEKPVEKPLFLSWAGDRQVRLIHLTRDPRGFALSAITRERARSGREPVTDGGEIADADLRRLATSWRRYHQKARLAIRLMGTDTTLTIRYEDLATHTGATMDRVLTFIGVAPLGPETRRDPARPVHAIGNKLLRSFDGSVALDERWRSELTASQATLVLRQSGSFAERQGYR
jgi:hypothetical protein